MSTQNFNFFDDINLAIISTTADLSVVYFNSAFLTLFKLTPRLVNKAEGLTQLIEPLASILKELSEKSIKAKTTVIGAEVSFVFNEASLTVIPRVAFSDSHLVISFNDMSVEKKLYDKYREKLEELKTSHEQIVQADKLKTIGEMSANISHEINNPLTVASGNIEIIEFTMEEEDLNSQRENLKEALQNIKESHDRINQIVAGMKEFLHKSEDRKEYCSVKDLVDRCHHMVKAHFEDNEVELKIKIEDSNQLILVNKIKVEQVIINLLQNAVDALSDSNTKNPIVTLEVLSGSEGSEVYFDVTDNGPGIKSENRERIFQAFFTTKEVGKGTGLGLSISSRIISAHQGKLQLLDSQSGAHFRIELPSIEVSSFVDNTSHFLSHENQSIPRILVVDNEPNILNLCQKFCEDQDFLLIGSTSGEAALKMLQQTKIDVVVTDYQMPGMNGSELAEAIFASRKNCPVIYMSGANVLEYYNRDKERFNVKAAILKPFTSEVFMSTIRGVLAGK